MFDTLDGGGANAASITFEEGHDDLAGSPNEAADAATTDTAGNFEKLNLSVSRQQRLTERVRRSTQAPPVSWRARTWTSEKLYLGGYSGVRAYPADEGGGSEGALANVQGAWPPLNFSAVGFFDYGTRFNRDNDHRRRRSEQGHAARRRPLARLDGGFRPSTSRQPRRGASAAIPIPPAPAMTRTAR